MKLLLDECLAYPTARALAEAGHDAIHAFDVASPGALDEELMRLAVEQGRTIVTFDADFHSLLAVSGATRPSVIRLRFEGLRPGPATLVILAVINHCGEALVKGAAVSVTANRIKFRPLPLRPRPQDPQEPGNP